MSIPRPYHADALGVDLARDEHLTAVFDDLYGLPEPLPYRRPTRGITSSAARPRRRGVADPSHRNTDDPSSSRGPRSGSSSSTKEHADGNR